MIKKTDYNGCIHQRYQEARRLMPDTGLMWMNIVRRFVDASKELAIVDLGSGTGRFSVLLADVLNAHVTGIEPSDKMRNVAMQESIHPRVKYIKGSAEEIPLEDGSFDLVWASMIIHHVSEPDMAAKEIYRIVKPGGKVFLRNSFKNRLQSVRFYEYFLNAYTIDNERLPSVEYIKKIFIENGFRFEHLEAVRQVIDSSLADHVERMRKRGLSTFELISDQEFKEGIRRMKIAARNENPSSEITEDIDFLVFSR
jgi:ubiquinone/menaquinone biosynthesis C-methylase UbiE